MRTKEQLYRDAKKCRTHCDLCDRPLRNIKTRFHAKMALCLEVLYRRAGRDWYVFDKATDDVAYRKLLGWNITKLKCWGLVETMKGDIRVSARVRWRLTRLGRLFVKGKVRIPSYCRIPTGTGNSVWGKPFGKRIFISEALPVDLEEIIREAF